MVTWARCKFSKINRATGIEILTLRLDHPLLVDGARYLARCPVPLNTTLRSSSMGPNAESPVSLQKVRDVMKPA
jgi:hypothetical protein